jgi:hypothetical protein
MQPIHLSMLPHQPLLCRFFFLFSFLFPVFTFFTYGLCGMWAHISCWPIATSPLLFIFSTENRRSSRSIQNDLPSSSQSMSTTALSLLLPRDSREKLLHRQFMQAYERLVLNVSPINSMMRLSRPHRRIVLHYVWASASYSRRPWSSPSRFLHFLFSLLPFMSQFRISLYSGSGELDAQAVALAGLPCYCCQGSVFLVLSSCLTKGVAFLVLTSGLPKVLTLIPVLLLVRTPTALTTV